MDLLNASHEVKYLAPDSGPPPASAPKKAAETARTRDPKDFEHIVVDLLNESDELKGRLQALLMEMEPYETLHMNGDNDFNLGWDRFWHVDYPASLIPFRVDSATADQAESRPADAVEFHIPLFGTTIDVRVTPRTFDADLKPAAGSSENRATKP